MPANGRAHWVDQPRAVELCLRVFRAEPGQVAGRRTWRAGGGGTLHRQRRGAATGPGRSTHRHPAKPACRPEPRAHPAATLKLLRLSAELPEPRRQRKPSMSTPKTALIIGDSRGLGLGLVKQLLKDGWDVTATVRDPNKADALKAAGPVQIEKLDMDDQQAVIALSQQLKGEVFDLLFVNAGVKGPDVQTPGGGATLAEVGQLFFTNAVAPINLAQRFVGQIRDGSGVLAFMSSVLGSVTIPDGSDLTLYKASKAALNSMTNSFITQLGEQKMTVLSLHPGWVKTDMGGENAHIDVETSVRGLVDQVNAYTGKGGHHFVDYRGNTIAW